jgi:O-methyltransferase involved in polyketide biosynthesis
MGLPYAQEIYDILLMQVAGTEAETEMQLALLPENLLFVPFFEARYRLLDLLMKATGLTNVLEIAAGLAPRGVVWTENPDVVYVELDLPKKSAQKRVVIETLVDRGQLVARPHLHMVGGDALNAEDFAHAVAHFKSDEPILIVHEGFLRYITHLQKRILAAHIHTQERRGGYWITPDIILSNEPMMRDLRIQAYSNVIHAKLDMDLEANSFESFSEALVFFESLDCEVEGHFFREVMADMVSPTLLDLTADDLEKFVWWRMAFVMTL